MKKYSGLCIGGPLDGRHAESDTVMSFKAIVNDPMPELFEPIDDEQTVSIKETTYIIKAFIVNKPDGSKEEFHVWCPDDKDEAFIMRQLLTSYERKTT